MKRIHDLSTISWQLAESFPYLWQFQPSPELSASPDLHPIPTRLRGSVQRALLEAGQLPDWNVGLNARACEWVENRHWIYEAVLPGEWLADGGSGGTGRIRLVCLGLDYAGWICLNGKEVASFRGSHVPHEVDLSRHLIAGRNVLRIVFDIPPRWLGQFGFTSRMQDWKPRFNYSWDWIPRNVQVGVSDAMCLTVSDGTELAGFRCLTDAGPAGGVLRAWGRVPSGLGTVRIELDDSTGRTVRAQSISAAELGCAGVSWTGLPVERWWPNLMGPQPLYALRVSLTGAAGRLHDAWERRVGFRNISWRACEGAPDGAEPWLCAVNDKEVFLQGVNYPPLSPYFADVTRSDHEKRLRAYRDIGFNILRLNACGILESTDFYELCDEMGIMVWQEMPLTSSGVENTPPEDPQAVAELEEVARSFVARRAHHPSLILWGGGNELVDKDLVPYDATHPTLRLLKDVFESEDPTRRFVPCSPSGPRFGLNAKDIGKGLHHDVHGPWKPEAGLGEWEEFWEKADGLFHSEVGSPGASPAELIRRYCGDLDPMPISLENPLWRNPISWWLEVKRFTEEKGGEPGSLEEYVAWSQERQARALEVAVGACKRRFPRCGGVILWTGHDCFPCPTNTSILDFHGDPKPAAQALRRICRGEGEPTWRA